jgi:type IV pilus assembly protein PilC
MPNYYYEVIDKSGNTKTDTFEAVHEEALVNKLQSEGYFIVSIRLFQGKTVSNADRQAVSMKFDHDSCRIEDLLVFSRQMATLLEAGVTMLRSLSVILVQIQSKQLYLAISQIYEQIEQGSSFSAALEKHPKIFNQFWISLAEVGEASGTMPLVLNKLAKHVEQEAAFRSAIISAMIYPCILAVVSIGAVMFFALFVGPRFEDIFTSMHADLPMMTKALLGTFDFIKHNFLWIVGFVAALVMGANVYISTPNGRLQFEKLIYATPILGEITTLIIVERFAAQMAILIESGVPILYSLEITGKMVDNKTCSVEIAKIHDGVSQGNTIATMMEQGKFFPVMTVQMIKVGEETGELGKMLKHVATFYQNSVEAFMKRFGTVIEPVMLVFMAVVIGIIVISIFLPLFKLGQGIHK